MVSKSFDRVKQSGEVFTPTPLVQEMLDKLPSKVFDHGKTFLDNSCGNGQFLIELLKKNIPIDNIYGVDLMADNVCDTIARLQLYKKFNKDFWKDSIPDNSLDHPGHSDDHDWQFLKDHKSYQRDYSIISVRFSHFNKGDAGVFEYSFDQTLWTKVHNIVCKDALDYDYEFDQKTKASLLQF